MTVSSSLYFQIYRPGGQSLEMHMKDRDSFVIGRRSKTSSKICDVHIDDQYASRRHCRVFRDPENAQGWMLEDLGSNNGTKFNGVPVVGTVPVSGEGWIQLGTTRITLSETPKFSQSQTPEHVDAEGGGEGQGQATTVLLPAKRGMRLPSTQSDDATVVCAPSGEDDATVVRTSPDDATIVHASAGEATMVQGHVEEGGRPQGDPHVTVVKAPSPSRRSESDPPERDPLLALQAEESVRAALQSGLARDLVNANYLDPVLAARLLEHAQSGGQTFFRTLVQTSEVKFIDAILDYVSERYGWELITTEEALADQVVETEWFPFGLAIDLGGVAFKTLGKEGQIRYGTVDPFDLALHDWVERCGNAPANRSIIHPDIFLSTLKRLKENPGDDSDVGISIDFTPRDEKYIRDQIHNVDVPQIVNYFLYRANLQGASDIHIEPTEELLLVRNRVDGILHKEISLPMDFHSEAVSRLKILSNMDVAEKRRPQDGRLAVVVRNNPIDVRVSSYPTVFGEKFVLRLLDKNALRPSIETLGLMDRDQRMLKEKLLAPYGLIMISGPTGSGKTTTLYSCLGGLDKTSKNVLTVEDPVEYRLPGVHQMQVNAKIGLTFASGLRTILRQDPDVIMVGETRDNETAAMAVQAALTGHIVFSTIHTNDAAGVITRLLDMGIEPFLVSTALSLAVAQRLIRTTCPNCHISVSGEKILAKLLKDGITPQRLESLDVDIDPEMEYTQGGGCSSCRNTGYLGRRAVFELFEMTDEARSLIMSGSPDAGSLKRLAKKKGMTTLISHGVQLVEEEVTTFEEILRVLGEES